jgi:hypothetical protein
MTKTFYILLDGNIIRDVIETPYKDYIEAQLPFPLPIGINGGWYRWDGDTAVADETLKPETELEQRVKTLQEENLMTLEAIAMLYEMLVGGAE